jgi:predicted amidophosphoribosyltransferase
VEVGKNLSSALALLLVRGISEGSQTIPHGKPVPGSARRFDVVAVVPAPSSSASMVQRGRLHTKELAVSVVETLQERGIPAELSLGLEMVGRRKKSVEVGGVKSRERRSKSGMVVRLRRFPENCHDVILVDDICTTGSTLLGCARQLHKSGYRVLHALTLAAVPD